MFILIRALCLVGFFAWPGTLVAEEFPSRPVKFIVPFPAGGPADTISRILTEKMATVLGQTDGHRKPCGRRRPHRHRLRGQGRA